MSTRLNPSPLVKKINSCVRPGVREVRASAWRPVSALIRLDLPTLERPANAISVPRIGGSEATEPEAATKSQAPPNRRRPSSISARVKSVVIRIPKTKSPGVLPGDRVACRSLLRTLLAEQRLDVVGQFDLGAVAAHDDRLLRGRQRVVPGPVDDVAGREARQHEGEVQRLPVVYHLLRRI